MTMPCTKCELHGPGLHGKEQKGEHVIFIHKELSLPAQTSPGTLNTTLPEGGGGGVPWPSASR